METTHRLNTIVLSLLLLLPGCLFGQSISKTRWTTNRPPNLAHTNVAFAHWTNWGTEYYGGMQVYRTNNTSTFGVQWVDLNNFTNLLHLSPTAIIMGEDDLVDVPIEVYESILMQVLTPSRALGLTAGSAITSLNTTTTEIEHLVGVTGNVQTNIDARAPTNGATLFNPRILPAGASNTVWTSTNSTTGEGEWRSADAGSQITNTTYALGLLEWSGAFEGLAIQRFDQPLTTNAGWADNYTITVAGINTRTNASNGFVESYLAITNGGDYRRKLIWGTNWNRLRIGVLLRINESTATNGMRLTNTLAVGMCAGTNSILSTNTTQFFGALQGAGLAGGQAWQYTNATPTYWQTATGCAHYRETNGVQHSTTSGSGTPGRTVSGADGDWTWYEFMIGKASTPAGTTWSTAAGTATETGNVFKRPRYFNLLSELLAPFDSFSTGSLPNGALADRSGANPTGYTWAVDDLDTVNIAWTGSNDTPGLEILAIGVRRIY